MAAPAILLPRYAITSSLAEASPLLTVPHLKLFRKDPGNEVCHLTLATSLGREYLNSPRSPDQVNSGNYNSNSTRYTTTIHPVTLQPDTDSRALKYSLLLVY